jgi:hypothetical protein
MHLDRCLTKAESYCRDMSTTRLARWNGVATLVMKYKDSTNRVRKSFGNLEAAQSSVLLSLDEVQEEHNSLTSLTEIR